MASTLTLVAGDGAHFVSYVFRARFDASDTATTKLTLSSCQVRTRGTWSRPYGWTGTGFVDAPTFAAVTDVFCREWQVRNPTKKCFVIGDQLAAHRHVEVARMATRYKVHCWMLVSKTSRCLQVLDEKCFACVKTVMRVLAENKVVEALLSGKATRDFAAAAGSKDDRLVCFCVEAAELSSSSPTVSGPPQRSLCAPSP